MKHTLVIDRFEGDKAILKTEEKDTVLWPKNKLPENSREGSVLVFAIDEDIETEKDKKNLAKNILNELLDTE